MQGLTVPVTKVMGQKPPARTKGYPVSPEPLHQTLSAGPYGDFSIRDTVSNASSRAFPLTVGMVANGEATEVESPHR